MNLETFKARARRKLELRKSSSQETSAHPAPREVQEDESLPQPPQPETKSDVETGPQEVGSTTDGLSGSDKFAAALAQAKNSEPPKNTKPTGEQAAHLESSTQAIERAKATDLKDLKVERGTSGRASLQALTGSPAQPVDSAGSNAVKSTSYSPSSKESAKESVKETPKESSDSSSSSSF